MGCRSLKDKDKDKSNKYCLKIKISLKAYLPWDVEVSKPWIFPLVVVTTRSELIFAAACSDYDYYHYYHYCLIYIFIFIIFMIIFIVVSTRSELIFAAACLDYLDDQRKTINLRRISVIAIRWSGSHISEADCCCSEAWESFVEFKKINNVDDVKTWSCEEPMINKWYLNTKCVKPEKLTIGE